MAKLSQVRKSAREFSHSGDLNRGMGMWTTMLFGGTIQGSTFIILNQISVKDFQFVV